MTRPDVTIIFLEVGQGDCTLLIDHSTSLAVLVDCPRGSERLVADEIQRYGASLDTAIVTHSHLDHFGGVLDAIEALGCTRLFYNHDTFIAYPRVEDAGGKQVRDPAVLASLRRALELDSDKVAAITEGTSASIGLASISVLAPRHADLSSAVVNNQPNIASAVVLIEVGEVRVLIGSDATAAAWDRLITEKRLPKVTACRWPHHGADLETHQVGLTKGLADTLDPQVIVVSVGAFNPYDHPAESFLQVAREAPAHLMCTNATWKCVGSHPQPCAASVSLTISGGTPTFTPALADHLHRVRTFPTPRCLVPKSGHKPPEGNGHN